MRNIGIYLIYCVTIIVFIECRYKGLFNSNNTCKTIIANNILKFNIILKQQSICQKYFEKVLLKRRYVLTRNDENKINGPLSSNNRSKKFNIMVCVLLKFFKVQNNKNNYICQFLTHKCQLISICVLHYISLYGKQTEY